MAKTETLYDDFNGSSLDTTKWDSYGGRNVQQVNGQLRINSSLTGNTYRGIQSKNTYDLTGSFTRINIASLGSGLALNGLVVELKLIKDEDVNELFFTFAVGQGGASLVAYKLVSGTYTPLRQVIFYQVNYSYLRIRESGGTIYYETSADGLNWSVFTSISNPFVITGLIQLIQIGNTQDAYFTTTVRFDDFNIVPPTSTPASDGGTTSGGNVPISNPINIKSIDKKYYAYKVYDTSGTFLGEWKDVASDLTYSQEINKPGSTVEVDLARSADTLVEVFAPRQTVDGSTRTTVNGNTRVGLTASTNSIGSGTDVDLRYKVEAYVFYGGQAGRITPNGDFRVTVAGDNRISDVGAPNGRKKFSGYITSYKSNYGEDEKVHITLYSYGAELKNHMLNNGGTTTITYNSFDPSNIFKDVLDKFTADGGIVDYDANSVDTSGTTVSYTFRTNTVQEAIDKCLELAPTDWYWYLDMATNTMFFRQKPETADHTFVLGKHIKSLQLEKTIVDLVNDVYFVGGDTGGGTNLLKHYTDSTSNSAYGKGLNVYSDNRVTTSSAADILGQSLIARGKDPQYRSQVDILSEVYDIEDIDVGDIIQFRGFNNFVDSVMLQIVGLTYNPDYVTLQLDSLLPSVSKRVEDIKRNLALQENQKNPSAPS